MSQQITQLIEQWQAGNEAALHELTPFVYAELKRLAKSYMRKESVQHTLQATALVNEAFIKLSEAQVDYQSRAHFITTAARIMRHILVDHARSKKSQKHGGNIAFTPFNDQASSESKRPFAILDLDRALDKLSTVDTNLALAVELIFFGGLSYDEAAAHMGKSRTLFYEDLRFAKAWLGKEIEFDELGE